VPIGEPTLHRLTRQIPAHGPGYFQQNAAYFARRHVVVRKTNVALMQDRAVNGGLK